MEKKSVVYIASNRHGLDAEIAEVSQLLADNGCLPLIYTTSLTEKEIQYNWSGAKALIDACDFMVVIIGNRYGDLLETGESCLHKEIAYGVNRGIPVMSFLKNISREEIKSGEEQKLKLLHKIAMKGYFKYWHLRDELVAQINAGLRYGKKQFNIQGWISNRENSAAKVGTLASTTSKKVDVANQNNSKSQTLRLDEVDVLWPVKFTAKVFAHGNITTVEKAIELTWESTFLAIGPELLTPVPEDKLKDCLELHVQSEYEEVFKSAVKDAHAVTDVVLSKQDFQKIKAYMNGLGVVKSVTRNGSPQGLWTLTSDGSSRLNRLLAKSLKSRVIEK